MSKYMDRDISWLSFNKRCLDETKKKKPLGEKVLFYGITADNLKEFLQVRYAIDSKEYSPKDLSALQEAIASFYGKLIRSWESFNDREGLVRSIKDLKKDNDKWAEKTFKREVFPALQPITSDYSKKLYLHPGTYILVITKKKDKGSEKERINYIEIPTGLSRYIAIPDKHYAIDTLDLIIDNLKYMFKDRKILNAIPFVIMRSAEVYDQVDEHEDPFKMIQRTLRERESSWITTIEVGSNDKKDISRIKSLLPVTLNTLIFATKHVGLGDLKHFPSDVYDTKDKLRKMSPVNTIPTKDTIFDYIKKQDRLLFHPYESYDTSMVRFLQDAAIDPDVVSMKISLYRVSDNSKIIDALLKAADKGKIVTVLVELKARFDEHHNMDVCNVLREGGVRIALTSPIMKTHAKVCIITRKEKNGLRTYCQVGTGNYSESNSKQYTDYSYFTADPDMGYDLTRFFDLLTSDQGEFKSRKVIYAPYNMRTVISDLIDGEMKMAKSGKPAAIICKCNAFTDDKMADKFIAAAKAGVKITMIIRGACILAPSKNITIHSIVGRFLEHSRVYVFGDKDPTVLIGSADLMHRNLSLRHELLIEVAQQDIKERILKHLDWYQQDNVDRRLIRDNYKYDSVTCDKDKDEFSVQDQCIKEAEKMRKP